MDTDKYRARHQRKAEKAAKRAQKPQCEAIYPGPKGPHRCTHTAAVRQIDGHPVCHFHKYIAPHRAVFTEEEARALRRSDLRKERLEIDQGV